jgi:hypothetical protein
VTHLLGEAIAVAIVTSKSGQTSRRASLPDALRALRLKMWRPLTARRHIADASVLAPAVMLAVSWLGCGSASAEIVVTVDKAKQRMFVIVNGEHRYTWPVSTGLGNTPSGSYRPQVLSRNHRSTIFNNAPMPYAIFYSGHYAIHGTTAVAQLGSRASKGCVRLHPSNAAVLFVLVQKVGPANTRIIVQDSVTRVAQR